MSKSPNLVPCQGSLRSFQLKSIQGRKFPTEMAIGSCFKSFHPPLKRTKLMHNPNIPHTQNISRTHAHGISNHTDIHMITPSWFITRTHSHSINTYHSNRVKLKSPPKALQPTNPRNSKINAFPKSIYAPSHFPRLIQDIPC